MDKKIEENEDAQKRKQKIQKALQSYKLNLYGTHQRSN